MLVISNFQSQTSKVEFSRYLSMLKFKLLEHDFNTMLKIKVEYFIQKVPPKKKELVETLILIYRLII